MRTLMAVIADGANVSDSGNMNILGIFDRIQVSSFPTKLPDMVLALRIGLEFEDAFKEHSLVVQVADEDGRQQGDIHITTGVGSIEAGDMVVLNQVVHFQHVEIEEAGQITFALLWNGERKWDIELRIEQEPEEQG